MRILVIGSGGREHCLIWKIAQSDRVKRIFVAPGNGGTATQATNVNLAADDITGLADFARGNKIDLTVVGPEQPLVKGVVDEFNRRGLKVFGPCQDLALLEGSKVFAKKLMARFALPTAGFRVFDNLQSAREYLDKKDSAVVIKADGLAAGKGVFICTTKEQADQAIQTIMTAREFADSGKQVVIEDCLSGEEASILALSDGKQLVPLASAQDHKRIYDGDLGPNTGGMGAYSPAPVVTAALSQQVDERILQPLISGLRNDGKQYFGILYVGLMVTQDGPQILEFNVRFGDPETQAILPRMKNDLTEVMLATIEGNLDKIALQWDNRWCLCVVIASGGYPGDYQKGKQILGLDQAAKIPETFIFHAGTKKEAQGYLTNGGRVLNVVALGENLLTAQQRVYQAIEKISFEKMHFRRDIGWRALRTAHS